MSSTQHKDAKTTTNASKQPAQGSHQEHPDAAYIKREDVGLVIAKGLAVMYKVQPKNPVDFLAKWLLNYSQVEKHQLSIADQQARVKEL